MLKEKIIIEVSAYWEIRDKSWGDKDASGRKYTTIYHGGWDITKCAGHPEINGGHGSPNFTETLESIRKYFMDLYSERNPNNTIIVKLKITKDDRNPTMDSYF